MKENIITSMENKTKQCLCHEEEVVTPKIRWKKLTYGLIYPAFFGNMVYDFFLLIQSCLNGNDLNKKMAEIVAVGAILIFFMLDYVHLNVDLEKSVPEEKKGKLYMFCDIAISFLFFLAVMLVKCLYPTLAILLLCFVPLLFAIYNIALGFYKNFHRIYALIGLLLLVICYCTCHYLSIWSYEMYLAIVSVLLMLIYLGYNWKYYWKIEK